MAKKIKTREGENGIEVYCTACHRYHHISLMGKGAANQYNVKTQCRDAIRKKQYHRRHNIAGRTMTGQQWKEKNKPFTRPWTLAAWPEIGGDHV